MTLIAKNISKHILKHCGGLQTAKRRMWQGISIGRSWIILSGRTDTASGSGWFMSILKHISGRRKTVMIIIGRLSVQTVKLYSGE